MSPRNRALGRVEILPTGRGFLGVLYGPWKKSLGISAAVHAAKISNNGSTCNAVFRQNSLITFLFLDVCGRLCRLPSAFQRALNVPYRIVSYPMMSYRVEVCMVLQCGRVGHRQKRSGLRVAGTGSELRLDTCRRLLQHQRWRLHNWRKVGNTIIFLCFLTELGSFWTDVTSAILSRDFVAR